MKKTLLILLLIIVLSQLATAQNEGLKYYIDATQAISSGDIEKAKEVYKLAGEQLDGELKKRAVMMADFLENMQYDATKPKLINKEGWFFIGEKKGYDVTILYHLYYDTKGNNIIHARFSGPVNLKDFLNEVGAANKFKKEKVTKSSKGYILVQKQYGFVTDIRIWDCDNPESSSHSYRITNVLTSTFGEEDYTDKFFEELDGCPGESVYPPIWIILVLILAVILIIGFVIYKKKQNQQLKNKR